MTFNSSEATAAQTMPVSVRSNPADDRLLRKYMPELDVLRGLAILAVILYHGLYWQNAAQQSHGIGRLFAQATIVGWLGVNLFFVLSGFLITGILIDSRGSPNYYHRFYLRRIYRILPMYLLITALLFATGYMSGKYLIYVLLFMANHALASGMSGYGVFWSLSVEEQFYMLWPAVVRKVSNRTLAIISIGLCLVEPVLRWLSVTGKIPLIDVRGNTFLMADNLACGALAAIFVRSRYGTLRCGRRVGCIIIAAGVMFEAAGSHFGINHRDTLMGGIFQTTPWNIAFTGLLLLMLSLRIRHFGGVWAAPLRFLGYISYGLYLIHILIFTAYNVTMTHLSAGVAQALQAPYTRFVIEISVSILVAWLSRKYFEDRFLRIKVERGDKPRKLLKQAP